MTTKRRKCANLFAMYNAANGHTNYRYCVQSVSLLHNRPIFISGSQVAVLVNRITKKQAFLNPIYVPYSLKLGELLSKHCEL
jgi:hypothetical protein